MIELGYMAKRVALCPEWLDVSNVRDIYAVCNCISEDFCDYVEYWKHNGYWFFDSATTILEIAAVERIDLVDASLLYYRGFEQQYDANRRAWTDYPANPDVVTNIVLPTNESILGFDIVSYSMQNSPEHSPLSCNHLAADVTVNEHCLIESLDYAIDCLENGVFDNSEPGPYRIIAVSSIEWPCFQ